MSNEEPLALEKPAHDSRANQPTPKHDVYCDVAGAELANSEHGERRRGVLILAGEVWVRAHSPPESSRANERCPFRASRGVPTLSPESGSP